ncbi:hypothetical protein [Pseudomonas sp. NCCP-436]|uniref:hypothetical protein n=1 Tax=Pseudomonas sp. NCCP-436 TaxID=2842481 RepID=UPI001C817D07
MLVDACHLRSGSSSCAKFSHGVFDMTNIQHLGLTLFVLLSAGIAMGHKTTCTDGRIVETYLAKALASQVLGHDMCQP